ncbi:unnamed protein product [Brachionus calyciflorus]|uniref:Uncharacterized protein n=1 Tax=Brachionus calyciflorus TaxID=104777 RepID=A0A814AI68_9BILA|nr:unnamed protein product [Brachionus calyciflorus]
MIIKILETYSLEKFLKLAINRSRSAIDFEKDFLFSKSFYSSLVEILQSIDASEIKKFKADFLYLLTIKELQIYGIELISNAINLNDHERQFFFSGILEKTVLFLNDFQYLEKEHQSKNQIEFFSNEAIKTENIDQSDNSLSFDNNIFLEHIEQKLSSLKEDFSSNNQNNIFTKEK